MAYTLSLANLTLVLSGMNGSGTLTAATSGFVTDEDDTSDVFTPSRLQTADIRIIDTGGHEWRNCIPASDALYPVTLYNNYSDASKRTVLWRGYLKSQAYTADLFDDPQTVTLVAHCPLTALQGFDINPDAYEIASFGQLIEHCVTSPGLANSPFNYFYFPDDNIIDRLKCRFPWALLYDIQEDYTKKAKYNCLEALEEFCRFFGFTMRYFHNGAEQGIQFLASDKNVDYKYFSTTELQNYNKTHSTSAIAPVNKATSYLNLDHASYLNGLDNSLEIIRGKKKVTVTADLMHEILDWSAETNMKRMFMGPVDNASYMRGTTWIAIRALVSLNNQVTARTIPCGDFNIYMPGVSYDTSATTLIDKVLYDKKGKGMQPLYIDLYNGDLTKKNTIDWKFAWQCYAPNSTTLKSTSGCGYMRTIKPLMFKEGYMCIDATAYLMQKINDTYYRWRMRTEGIQMYAYLKIGDYYWNVTSKKWTKNAAVFAIDLTSDEDADYKKGAIKSNITTPTDGFIGYSGGHVVKVDSTTFNATSDWANGVEGIVEFGVSGAYSTVTNEYITIYLEDLSLKFIPFYTDNEEEQKSEVEYVKKNANAYTDDREENVIFASNNGNHYGSSILTENGQKPIQLIKQFGSTGVPEEALATRISSFYAKGKEILTLHLNIYYSKDFPYNQIVYGGKRYNCIGISRDYEKDDATITVIEI